MSEYDEGVSKHKSSSGASDDEAGGVAFAQFTPAGSCFACGKKGHSYQDCPNATQEIRDRADKLRKAGAFRHGGGG